MLGEFEGQTLDRIRLELGLELGGVKASVLGPFDKPKNQGNLWVSIKSCNIY